MIEQFNNLIEKVNPSKYYIYDALRFNDDFNELSNFQKESIINFIYSTWIDIDNSYLDILINIALDNIDNILNNDNFDFQQEYYNNL